MGCDMRALFKNFSFWKLIYCQRGATAVEYGLILALIVLAIMGAVSNVANKTIGMWNNVATEVLAH
jgi:pilus assembly protein Flp/PilA